MGRAFPIKIHTHSFRRQSLIMAGLGFGPALPLTWMWIHLQKHNKMRNMKNALESHRSSTPIPAILKA